MIPTLGHWLILLAIGACAFNIGATVFAYRSAHRAPVARSRPQRRVRELGALGGRLRLAHLGVFDR